MIYLIDDSDLIKMNAEYVFEDKYKDILCLIQKISEFEKQEMSMQSGECLMVHLSFPERMYVRVKDIAKCRNIPFVCFSGGDTETGEIDEEDHIFIGRLKKSAFYERLQFFLDSFIEKKEVNLMLLAYGNNYKSKFVSDWSLEIMKETNNMSGVIDRMGLRKITNNRNFKKLIDESGLAYTELIKDLSDNPITIERFRCNINKIVSSFYQYGKNIYTWE